MAIKKKSKHFLFHFLLKEFRHAKLKYGHFLVAVSGGKDSIALLALLIELKSVIFQKLSVVHVHHGSHYKQQKKFQDTALKVVKNFCQKNNIDFYTNKKKPTKENHSEDFLRKYRYKIFNYYFKKISADYLLLAHTADDLLETRLFRLIRGTSTQGLLAMSFKNQHLIRPLLKISRLQIESYIKKSKLKFSEDPSNHSVSANFRSWLRLKWLKPLENKQPGSLKSLARSLDVITCLSKSREQSFLKKIQQSINGLYLCRDILLEFSYSEQSQIIAYYFRTNGFTNYGVSHIEEFIKQITSSKKRLTFFLLEKKWIGTQKTITFKDKKNN